MTAKEIIRAALRINNSIGATEEPTAADYASCLEFLNMMGNSWSAEGLLVFAFARESFTLTADKGEYTLGDGGDFDTDRPAYIDSAQIKYPDSDVEYRVDIVPQNKYDNMSLKTIPGRPTMLFYNPTYPKGTVTLYYVPDQAYSLRLNMRHRLGEFSNIADTVQFPEEYRLALVLNLAILIAPMWGFNSSQDTKRSARDAKDVLITRNAANDSGIAELDPVLSISNYRRQTTRGEFFGD